MQHLAGAVGHTQTIDREQRSTRIRTADTIDDRLRTGLADLHGPRSEVCLADRGIPLHVFRPAACDQLPVIEHPYPVGDTHDELHVVLHQQDSDARLSYPPDAVNEIGPLPSVHAGTGLIQEQQTGLRGQRSRNLHEPLLPIGQRGGR